ncbi:hypothetical protein N2152v2_001522 [Parachlorella kessleri]
MARSLATAADLGWADRQMLEQASGMVFHKSCSYTYGWYWFLTFFQFAAVLCGMVAATSLWRGSLKPGSLALLAIITTLILESTKVFLSMHYLLPHGMYYNGSANVAAPLTQRAVKCALAGGILVCVANALVAIALGWRKDCTCEGKSSCSNAGATAYITSGPAADKAGAAAQV